MKSANTVDFGGGFRLGYDTMCRVFVYGYKHPSGKWAYQCLCLDTRAWSIEHKQAVRNSLASLVRALRKRGTKLSAREYRFASGSELHQKFLAID
jgi:hypothetical protein